MTRTGGASSSPWGKPAPRAHAEGSSFLSSLTGLDSRAARNPPIENGGLISGRPWRDYRGGERRPLESTLKCWFPKKDSPLPGPLPARSSRGEGGGSLAPRYMPQRPGRAQSVSWSRFGCEQGGVRHGHNRVAVELVVELAPNVASEARQRWAQGRNPFGIEE